jgi:hypothetical protein
MFEVNQSSEHPSLRSTEAAPRSEFRKDATGRYPVTFIGRLGIFLAFLVAVGVFVLPACAYTTPEGIEESGKVYTSAVQLDPGTLFSGDKCTITYFVTNGNANQSVAINHVTFGESKDISLISNTYDTNTNIGPLQTRAFVFLITTNANDGSYFPTFSMSFRDADSLYYRTQVKVDNTDLILAVQDKPDTFTQDKKDTIILKIANPRENDVDNVVVKITGDGISTNPSEDYVGTMAAGSSANVTFAVTPSQETTMKITVTYDNGDNHHSVEKTLPVTFGTDKKKAAPQISNIQIKNADGVYHITGDVTNAGLTTANGVTVTTLTPAVPEDPYQSYVIGALKPDDFGSFEVTFRADGATGIPLQISYKDTDGNIVTSQKTVSISNVVSSESSSQSGGNILIPLAGLIVLVVIGGVYLYQKRKKSQQ